MDDRSPEPVELVEGLSVRIAGAPFRIGRLIYVRDDDRSVAVLIDGHPDDSPGSQAVPAFLHQVDGERYSHVDDDVQPLLWGGETNRRARFHVDIDVAERPPWISRRTQDDVATRLHALTDAASAGVPSRLVIAGPRGAGKVSVAKRFRDERNGTADGESRIPVVFVRAWSSTHDFYEHCLDGIDPQRRVHSKGVLRRPGMKNDDRRAIVAAAFSVVDVRLLIIANLYGYSSPATGHVRPRIETLETFADELGLGMACLQQEPLSLPGTWSSAWRSAPVVPLTPCGLDAEFREALVAFERRLPLREPSALIRRDLAGRLHARSRGNLGGLWFDLVALTEEALATRTERIDHELIDRVEERDRKVQQEYDEREAAWGP